MIRKLLIRGMLTGLIAGLLAFGVAKILGEPQVDKAIAFESYVEYTVHHQTPEAALVSRSLQNSAGLGTGVLIYGIAFGGIFALVFAVAYGRLGTLTARGTAAVLGLLGFISVYLVPNLKYPANPPSIGNPDTISRRTGLYLLMILISVVVMVLVVIARKKLRDRLGEWNSTIVVGARLHRGDGAQLHPAARHQRSAPASDSRCCASSHRRGCDLPADSALALPSRVIRDPSHDVVHHRDPLRPRRSTPSRAGIRCKPVR